MVPAKRRRYERVCRQQGGWDVEFEYHPSMLFGRRNGDPIDVEVVAETVAEDQRAIIGSVIDEHKRRSLSEQTRTRPGHRGWCVCGSLRAPTERINKHAHAYVVSVVHCEQKDGTSSRGASYNWLCDLEVVSPGVAVSRRARRRALRGMR